MSFKALDPEDFLISADSITATAWSTNQPSLTAFFTSSVAASSDQFYQNVFQTASNSSAAAVQFAVTYGNPEGSGSLLYNNIVPGKSPSRSVYGQFRTLIYGDENADFVFGGVTGSDFWVISVERARYKQSLMKGTFNLTLGNGASTLHLTDNSKQTSVDTFLDCGRVYQIVSGSNGASYNTTNGFSATQGSYGLFLPDVGLIVINANATSQTIGLTPTRTSNQINQNPKRFIRALRRFQLNSEETVTADYVYVRARNAEYNYSENPSFISGSTGEVLFDEFINSPQTYITTVGLYNDINELVAVAKLSRPLLKDFTKEMLVRIKLAF